MVPSERSVGGRHPARNNIKRWTNELFKIVDVLDTVPLTYKLYDLYGEEILGLFYAQELQKTNFATEYDPVATFDGHKN